MLKHRFIFTLYGSIFIICAGILFMNALDFNIQTVLGAIIASILASAIFGSIILAISFHLRRVKR